MPYRPPEPYRAQPQNLDEELLDFSGGDDPEMEKPDPRYNTERSFRSTDPYDYMGRMYQRDAERASGVRGDPRNALTRPFSERPYTLSDEEENRLWNKTQQQTRRINGLHDRTALTEGREAGDLWGNSPSATRYMNRLGDDLSDYWNQRYATNRDNLGLGRTK